MLLPAQAGAAEVDVKVLVGRARRGDAAALAQLGQRLAVFDRLLANGVEGEMQDAGRVSMARNGRACTSPRIAARRRWGSSRLSPMMTSALMVQSGDMGPQSWQAAALSQV